MVISQIRTYVTVRLQDMCGEFSYKKTKHIQIQKIVKNAVVI